MDLPIAKPLPAPPNLPLAQGPSSGTVVWQAAVPSAAVPSAAALEERLAALGSQGGDIQVSLGWNTRDDLDLVVVPPCGGKVWFLEKRACNGVLDVDSNVSEMGVGLTDMGAENIFWAAGKGQPGEYKVRVLHTKDRSRLARVEFGIRINRGGRIEFHSGSVAPDGEVDVARFNWP